jgi:hypothetical protein
MIADAVLLNQSHRRFLHVRAVSGDVATERGYQSVTRKVGLEKLGFARLQQLVPALVIPVWSVRGEVESYQLRPDIPRLNETGKAQKYEMKSGGRMLLDAHPRLTRRPESGNVPLISNPSVPLFITEGIPKGDAAATIGLCCIALLGVWNFRGTNEAGGKTALADWESIALNNRFVYIAFDSDIIEKGQVYGALVRLKAFLESRGARVNLIYLPAGEHGEKIGLDDFIAHEKASGRCDAEIRDGLLALATPQLRKPQSAVADLAEITIEPGRMPQIVDAAEKVLIANATSLRIFQRSGQIVRVMELDKVEEGGGLNRPSGTVQLASATSVYLQETFERLIRWVRIARNTGEVIPASCPVRVPATYLERKKWELPILRGVVEAPILRPDGSILSVSGYDDAIALFLCADDGWPPVLDVPTRQNAEAALRDLLEPFSEFPFVDEASRSVMIAAILTAIQRRLLESAPLFAFDAPSQRSGKSLLAEAVGLIAMGRRPAATGVSRSEEELRKAITSALLEGQAIVNLDNITHSLDSPHLARAITQSLYSDRHLGVNEMLRLSTNILWTASGNNLTFRGDLPSRALISRIDAGVERPEERTFRIADLPTYLLANRKRLVAAVLTILRAYHVAGRPRQDILPWGGFDHWSREIREPLVWLGLPDPCATREQIIVSDPDRELTIEVLNTWQSVFGDRVMLAREIIAAVRDGNSDELKQVLLMIAAKRDDSNQIDARRLGAWCASKVDRVIGGLRLSIDRKIRHAQGWRVSCVSSVSLKAGGRNGETHTHSDTPVGRATESVSASPPLDRARTNSPNSPDSPDAEIEEGSL